MLSKSTAPEQSGVFYLGGIMQNGGKRMGAGRRPLFAKTKKVLMVVDQEVWDKIPEPKSAWVRDAMQEKLLSQK